MDDCDVCGAIIKEGEKYQKGTMIVCGRKLCRKLADHKVFEVVRIRTDGGKT